LMLGDLRTGYMVMPIAPDVHARLGVAAAKYGVPMA
jgi:predicted RNase H-like nuclease